MRELTRRQTLAAAAATTVVAALPARAAGALVPLASAGPLIEAAGRFLGQLDPKLRKTATFAWGGRDWRNWNYFGGSGFIKPGLRLEQMTAPQQDAAWGMLATVLSPAGLEKTRNVMLLQDVLAASGNGAGRRSSSRFSFAVFGTPDPVAPWGLRVEGHHLSLSFAVAGGHIVSVTPSAFAAYPNRVGEGKHKGLITLGPEEQLARRLRADLAGKPAERAQAGDDRLFNILSTAGRERANGGAVGIAVADLAGVQRDLLAELIEAYAVAPFHASLQAAQRQRSKYDPGAVHFAWYGPNEAERSFGYRVVAPGLVIELGCVDRAAQHIHPIYHDLGNVLGTTG